ncbi:MAG: hypothetical protein IPJ89_01035 [Candidatus Iainarchaeum archaeon]|uniref:NFACT family protein n=1 Tax=Candidatus Iainarchaeum sp. TaxID=3101447 RepID=A0A7T9I289_9ARCH|nr:MAG: hypothetical protein IPJ89_01035 [Candidatus Diapherotrites archaeon]
MPSFQLSSQQLHAIAKKWNEEWRGSYFNQFRAVGENTFQFKINTKQEKVSLLVKLPNLAWVSQRKWDVLPDQPPIVNKTKALFENQKINSVAQHGSDRILVITCTAIRLILELFGEGNIIVTENNENRKILAVLAAREWKGRTLKGGQPYQFPQNQNKLPEKKEAAEAISVEAIDALFSRIEAVAFGQQDEEQEAVVRETKTQLQKKALEINLERQQKQMQEWEKEIAELQSKGEWIYAHFAEVEALIHALQRAKKQKVNEKDALKELQKKIKGIKTIDFDRASVEWEAE